MLYSIFKRFKFQVSFTLFLVLVETITFVFIPFSMGKAIDGLLNKNFDYLILMLLLLVFLVVLSTLRRLYDTKAYGDINEKLSYELTLHHKEQKIDDSVINARINFLSEITKFFEEDLPQIIQSFLQIVGAIILLSFFDFSFFIIISVSFLIVFLIFYLSKSRYTKYNFFINRTMEKQISILNLGFNSALKRYFRSRKINLRKVSNLEALNFGFSFLFLMVAVICNLLIAAYFKAMSVGEIFSVVSYTWDCIESIMTLPLVLQNLFRINEISDRLSSFFNADSSKSEHEKI